MTESPSCKSSDPLVGCVILNWNGWRDTIDCLNALEKCTYRNFVSVVVDNGSTDDSVARIQDIYPDLTILQATRNLGFAGGNNLGIRYALAKKADYIWLLNNDAKPLPDALSALVSKAVADKRIGAVGSICYYAERPDVVQIWAGGRVNLWIGYSPYATEPHADDWFHWLNGTSLLLACMALEHVGLLDEKYFLYWEDTELSLRLRRNGWRLAVAADSQVLHKVSASTGRSRSMLDRYTTASGLRTLRLYAPIPPISMLLFIGMRVGRRLMRLQLARCQSVWLGIRDYFQARPISSEVL